VEDRLKQRLLGAVVVIALAVIFIPELLKDAEEPDKSVANTEMPSRPPQTIIEPDEDETVSLPLVTGSSAGSAPALDSQVDLRTNPADETILPSELRAAQPIQPADGDRAVVDNERVPSPLENSVTLETTRPDMSPNTAAVTESDSPNAPAQEFLFNRVDPNAAQLPPGVTRPEPIPEISQSPRAEPAPTESSAAPSVDLPQVDLIGRSGTENPPAMASADTTAMTQTGNWVVQAGSFSQQENANDLRDKLIGQGFDAFVESSDTAGQTLYRVRIGPQSSRGQGESTLARLRALGFDGQVVSLRN
jgi:DedD protein